MFLLQINEKDIGLIEYKDWLGKSVSMIVSVNRQRHLTHFHSRTEFILAFAEMLILIMRICRISSL